MTPRTLLAAALALAAGCSRGPTGEARPFSADAARAAATAAFDPDRPEGSLLLDADEVARRLGSFEWTAGVEWTVTRQGSAERVRAVEAHRLVQAATGEFFLSSEIDPGLGDGDQTGRDVIWAGNMTYARNRWAPWRERPTDRGRDARRYRADSFGIAADLAALLGPRLSIARAESASDGLHYTLGYAAEAPEPAPAKDTRTYPQGGPDADTKVRLAFLDGAQPVSAKGELVLDEKTGAPVRIDLDAAFGVKADPRARIQVSLRAKVKNLGAAVPSVTAPKDALPDARKPQGVAEALERAGLKKKDEKESKKGEPGDDAEP